MSDQAEQYSEIATILRDAKQLAQRYYKATGRPLGITGEIAEFEAVRLLGLTMADARQAGWDATRILDDGSMEKLQIKGRAVRGRALGRSRIGKIDLRHDFDAVLLVVLDENLNATSIHRAERAQIEAALQEPGSVARNVRGQLSLSKFFSFDQQVWSNHETSRVHQVSISSESVWPIPELRARLSTGDFLYSLCRPREAADGRNVREHLLESLFRELAEARFGASNVSRGKLLRKILPLPENSLLANARPDLIASLDGTVHVCEIKSNRTDYMRAECVVGRDLARHLKAIGHNGPSPWEVEQDIIRLLELRELSEKMGSCTLIFVDAYRGKSSSWTDVFSDGNVFRSRMRTARVRDMAKEIVSRTSIETVSSANMSARMIVCELGR